MRRPLVIVVLLYVCGVLLAEVLRPPMAHLFGAAFGIGLLALIWPAMRGHLLYPLVILAGWANIISHTAIISPHDLRLHLPDEAAIVSVRGTLAESPNVRMFIRDEEPSYRTLAALRVTEIQINGTWQPAHGRVMTMTPGDLNGFAYRGTKVELSGVMSRPEEPVVAGLFNYRTYLARQGIYFQLSTGGTHEWQLLSPATPGLGDRFIAWSQNTLGRGMPERDEPLMLLYAMTLGWKTGLLQDVYEPFMFSGTMHIFAISGLHIALIAGILVALLRLLQIRRRWCAAVVIPLLWFYAAATGWQPSAVRATLMTSVIVLGWSLARPTDLLNSLAAAALLILLWEPQQLFQASFQLSFCVVVSIALLTPPLQRTFDRWLATDEFVPRDALPWWRRWLDTAFRWLAMSFATSLAAWLGSLPLTAHYFHVFSPITLLANLMIVPLSGAALASCVGSLACGDWLPALGEWFNHGAWFWMKLMMNSSHWSAELPRAYWFVASPPAWAFGAYYLMLVGLLSGWLFRAGHRIWALLAIFLITVGSYWEWQRAQDRTEIVVLPLNGGHAVYVDASGTENDWLMDCGDTNAVEFITRPFLRARGVNHLPQILLTHGDNQHMGGVKLIWESFNVGKTYTSPVVFRSGIYREVMQELAANPERHAEVARGEKLGAWTVLHPSADDKFTQADDACVVLQSRIHKTRLLLLGDLGRPGQELLMTRYPYLDSDIVITGLPEKGEALCNGLINRTHPRRTIVADSEYPATKRASKLLIQRLEEIGARAWFTRELGAITITVRPEGTTIRGSRNDPSQQE